MSVLIRTDIHCQFGYVSELQLSLLLRTGTTTVNVITEVFMKNGTGVVASVVDKTGD